MAEAGPPESASAAAAAAGPMAGGQETRQVTPLHQFYRLHGKVVKGFGRGSRQLGTPTANMDPCAFQHVLGKDAPEGVYVGWASVEGGPVYKAILSIGTNPHFDGVETTVESYLVHKFEEDFYGADMALLICGYIRPMWKFNGLDELIAAINRDIEAGCEALDSQETLRELQHDAFFRDARRARGSEPAQQQKSQAEAEGRI